MIISRRGGDACPERTRRCRHAAGTRPSIAWWRAPCDRACRPTAIVERPDDRDGQRRRGLAMTRLVRAGGHTLAESEATAVVWGMPGELVRAGGISLVRATWTTWQRPC